MYACVTMYACVVLFGAVGGVCYYTQPGILVQDQDTGTGTVCPPEQETRPNPRIAPLNYAYPALGAGHTLTTSSIRCSPSEWAGHWSLYRSLAGTPSDVLIIYFGCSQNVEREAEANWFPVPNNGTSTYDEECHTPEQL